jgi:CP family cyanate transporter-like MFS transporter
MTDLRALPLWAGRTVALLGLLLVALNLRTAVAAISPIVRFISVDIPLSSLDLGIIGAVAPIAFALSALFGAMSARRVGIERLLLLAIVAMIVGQALRALSTGFPALFGGTVIALIGAGICNVLLPPLVKRYFADRVGLVTSLYVTLISVSTAMAAALAAPIAETGGWRLSLGLWSALGITALIPWLTVLLRHRSEPTVTDEASDATEIEQPHPQLARRMWRSRTAWMIGIVFAVSTFSVYACVAWLPEILIDIAGLTTTQAGAYLAVWSIIGVPSALIIPMLTARLKNVSVIVYVGVAVFAVGYLGLLLVPTVATLLWVILIGAGPLMFPACLTLIGLRSRTQAGSVALSGVVQTIGYSFGALGPLMIGILHSATGDWTAALIVLLAISLVCLVVARSLSKPVFVEDEVGQP